MRNMDKTKKLEHEISRYREKVADQTTDKNLCIVGVVLRGVQDDADNHD